MSKLKCFLGFHKWEKIESDSYNTKTTMLKCPECKSEINFSCTNAGAQNVWGKISWITPRTKKQYSALQKYFKRILMKYNVLQNAGLPARDKNGFSYSLGNRKQRRTRAQEFNRYKRRIK